MFLAPPDGRQEVRAEVGRQFWANRHASDEIGASTDRQPVGARAEQMFSTCARPGARIREPSGLTVTAAPEPDKTKNPGPPGSVAGSPTAKRPDSRISRKPPS